ncbi:MAG: malonyl-ACP O-methyltransferase BioC [Tannerella sp.]|jgi:malonyl-CoA O-methyltransferase/biotin synthesis protein BioG|nr:malonyl-ACP O-methyltransferase BioC [Tannerella sp.]
MNKELIARRFAKAAASYEEEAGIQRQIACKMAALLASHVRTENRPKILEIGCGTGVFSRLLIGLLDPAYMLLNDLCPGMQEQLKDIVNDRIIFRPGDAETYPFEQMNEPYDLIASCSAIQWFGDPDAFFTRMHRLLAADGLFAFSTFGNDNMKEISSLTGQSLPYFSPEELKMKLAGRYDLLYISEERIPKQFNHPKEILYHLKRTGVTGIRQQPWTRARFTRFCDEYRTRYSHQGKVILTYHPVYIIAQKKRI